MKEFRDKVAVITGGASGIGRGIAQHCVQEGMKVVIADIEEPALIETDKALKAIGGDVRAVRTDVSKAGDIERLGQKTIEMFGAVHMLFNNAGVSGAGRPGITIWENTLDDWEWVMGINLWGVIHGIRVFVPIMLKQQTECHIVNTASVSAFTSGPVPGTYQMTKHAVASLTETLYLELKRQGAPIGVSLLCPGFTRTRIFETERNRPGGPRNLQTDIPQTPEGQAMRKLVLDLLPNAMSPDECAKKVFDAIRQNSFYIFPEPKYKEDIQQRMENILQGKAPTPQKHFP